MVLFMNSSVDFTVLISELLQQKKKIHMYNKMKHLVNKIILFLKAGVINWRRE